jgi:non-heme Fe2+,alpha-ketoglutarate-dependent halogenase
MQSPAIGGITIALNQSAERRVLIYVFGPRQHGKATNWKSRMPKRLTEVQLSSYRENGIVFPIAVLPPAVIGDARRRVESILQNKGGPVSPDILYYKTNLVFRWLDEIAHSPALLDAVEDLIGPDILLWSCSFAIKQPHSPGHFTWHQDARYWGQTPPIALTCWLAFGRVGRENGSVRFLLGSHRFGILPHRETFGTDNFLSRGQEVAELPANCAETAAILQPGEISIHDALTIHGSGPNESDQARIGCLLTFIPTYVRHERVRESAMLMRGFDRFGYHDLEGSPSGDMLPADLEARRAAMQKMGTHQDETRLSASGQAR